MKITKLFVYAIFIATLMTTSDAMAQQRQTPSIGGSGSEGGNGGVAVVMPNGDVVLADPFIRGERPVNELPPVAEDRCFSDEELNPELRAARAVYNVHFDYLLTDHDMATPPSRGPVVLNSDNRVARGNVRYCLVPRREIRNRCPAHRASDYRGIPAGARLAVVGCTTGDYTYLDEALFRAMTVRMQALTLIHERLHARDPGATEEVVADVTSALAVIESYATRGAAGGVFLRPSANERALIERLGGRLSSLNLLSNSSSTITVRLHENGGALIISQGEDRTLDIDSSARINAGTRIQAWGPVHIAAGVQISDSSLRTKSLDLRDTAFLDHVQQIGEFQARGAAVVSHSQLKGIGVVDGATVTGSALRFIDYEGYLRIPTLIARSLWSVGAGALVTDSTIVVEASLIHTSERRPRLVVPPCLEDTKIAIGARTVVEGSVIAGWGTLRQGAQVRGSVVKVGGTGAMPVDVMWHDELFRNGTGPFKCERGFDLFGSARLNDSVIVANSYYPAEINQRTELASYLRNNKEDVGEIEQGSASIAGTLDHAWIQLRAMHFYFTSDGMFSYKPPHLYDLRSHINVPTGSSISESRLIDFRSIMLGTGAQVQQTHLTAQMCSGREGTVPDENRQFCVPNHNGLVPWALVLGADASLRGLVSEAPFQVRGYDDYDPHTLPKLRVAAGGTVVADRAARNSCQRRALLSAATIGNDDLDVHGVWDVRTSADLVEACRDGE